MTSTNIIHHAGTRLAGSKFDLRCAAHARYTHIKTAQMQASCSPRCLSASSSCHTHPTIIPSSSRHLPLATTRHPSQQHQLLLTRARAASSNGNGTAPPPPTTASTSAAAAYEQMPGPRNAFVPGQESETRQQLFNSIAPVYDEVGRAVSLLLLLSLNTPPTQPAAAASCSSSTHPLPRSVGA